MFNIALALYILTYTLYKRFVKKYRVQLFLDGNLIKDYRVNILPKEKEFLIFRDNNNISKEAYEVTMVLHYQQPFECVILKVNKINMNNES
jgi:hypothetical protein